VVQPVRAYTASANAEGREVLISLDKQWGEAVGKGARQLQRKSSPTTPCLGGLTTFSTFSAELVALMQQQRLLTTSAPPMKEQLSEPARARV
jgi:hypothetical protein